jgi:type IV secretory pathway protease TraF
MRGEWYGPVYDEVGGRVLPQLAGCHTVAAGEVFLASKEPYSLDSRYFGMVPVAMITAQAVPLFTWR